MMYSEFTFRPRRSPRLALATALLLGTAGATALATPAMAQNATAALHGRITQNGTPAGTQVTALEVDTGYRSVSRITNGNYNFPSLRPGRYRLIVQTADGTRQTDVFPLQVGQNAGLDFDLAQPAAGATAPSTPPDANAPAETGTATAESAPAGGDIVVTSSKLATLEGGEVGVNVTQHTIETLPQNNRNFLAFADLAPGVQFLTDANGNQHLQGGAQPDSAINVFVDGISKKDYVLAGGITGQDSSSGNPFPQLGIAQYRVISQNYKAEYGQVSSAAITAVTKSGTNTFHGEGFFDFSNQGLRAKTAQEAHDGVAKTKTQDMQFGAALGGPIIKDKLHFFVTYEGKRQKQPVDIYPGGDVQPADVPQPYRDAYGTSNRTFNEDLYFGKLDFEPSDADLFELSATVRRETGLDWSDGQNARSFTSNIHNNETSGLLRYQHSADTWVNDLRLSYQDSSWNPTPNTNGQGYAQTFETANGTQLLNYGAGVNYQNKGQKGFTFKDDFTFTGVEHNTLKFGVEARWLTLTTLQRTPYNPRFYYDTEYPAGGFNDQTPYKMEFGVPVEGSSGGSVRTHDFQLGLYAQDDYQASDRLTVNFGLRWDYERDTAYLDYVTPSDVVSALQGWSNIQNTNYDINDYISNGHNRHPNLGELQPRLGFTYDLTRGGRFQLFGGYGRSYSIDQFDFLSLERLQASYKTVTYNFNTGDPNHPCPAGSNCIAWNPAYLTPEGRAGLTTAATSAGSEIDLINNKLKVPYSDQVSIGTRGRFGRLQAEVGYTHVASRNGFAFVLGNRTPTGGFFVPGGDANSNASPPWGYGVPGYGNLILGTNGLETNSDSAYLKLTKNYSEASPWSLNLTYTFTLAEENRAFGEHYSLDFPTLADYPFLRSTGVPKHRVVVAGSVDIPLGLQLSGRLLLQTPEYIYGTRRADVADPQNYPAQPTVIEGNNRHPFIAGNWWAVRQLDLALTKYVDLGALHHGSRLRLRADVFNVFNWDNWTGYNGDGNSPTFGDVNSYATGGYPPRTVKLTVGVSF